MPRSRRRGEQTREQILEVALELFTEQGYDKTSLRDISERLGITKAALYYYFERKEEILLELHLRMHQIGYELLDEIEAVEDGPARFAAWPAAMNRMIDELIGNRKLMLLHRRNYSAIYALHGNDRNVAENEELEARLVRILRSDKLSPDQRLRMACTVGAITEILGDSNAAFADLDENDLVGLIRPVIADILGIPAPVEAA